MGEGNSLLLLKLCQASSLPVGVASGISERKRSVVTWRGLTETSRPSLHIHPSAAVAGLGASLMTQSRNSCLLRSSWRILVATGHGIRVSRRGWLATFHKVEAGQILESAEPARPPVARNSSTASSTLNATTVPMKDSNNCSHS